MECPFRRQIGLKFEQAASPEHFACAGNKISIHYRMRHFGASLRSHLSSFALYRRSSDHESGSPPIRLTRLGHIFAHVE